MTHERSTFSLIGDQYLDTQHDAEYIASLERELQERGVVGVRRVLLEYLAASSLWWNVFWWDWCNLDERDVKLGWQQNLALFAMVAAVSGILEGLLVAVFCTLGLHLVTLWIGLGLRSGTKLEE